MDVAGLSMTMSTNQLQNQVGVAMLRNSMDQMKAEGAQMAQMVAEAPAMSLEPGKGGAIDIRI